MSETIPRQCSLPQVFFPETGFSFNIATHLEICGRVKSVSAVHEEHSPRIFEFFVQLFELSLQPVDGFVVGDVQQSSAGHILKQ